MPEYFTDIFKSSSRAKIKRSKVKTKRSSKKKTHINPVGKTKGMPRKKRFRAKAEKRGKQIKSKLIGIGATTIARNSLVLSGVRKILPPLKVAPRYQTSIDLAVSGLVLDKILNKGGKELQNTALIMAGSNLLDTFVLGRVTGAGTQLIGSPAVQRVVNPLAVTQVVG